MLETTVTAPASGEDRWRVEVLEGGKRRTITSHVWIRAGSGSGGSAAEDDGGCGCSMRGGAWLGWSSAILLAFFALTLRRRKN